MKNTGFVILCCIFALILLPLIFVQPIEKQKENIIISVLNTSEDKIEKMELEEYVLRVLEKEMGINYSQEALKAQAVAIRTYALRKRASSIPSHKGAELCTDYRHCMAYNFDASNHNKKFKDAVNATKGEVLKYNNELAATFFFAISAGKTQNCKDVWGGDLPYLVSVNSSYDENRQGFLSEKSFTYDEIKNLLHVDITKEYLLTYYDSGYVEKLVWDDKVFDGDEIRKKLNLRSSSFSITKDDNNFIFKVKGYGHGVGMSQQGADELARQGKTYKEILGHYYKGTYIEKNKGA